MIFGEIVWELLLLHIRNGINILELSLSIPILIEEVVVASELLSNFADKMQVLLSHESWNEDVAVLLIQNLNPDEPLSSHHGFHESEVEAPYHDDT